MCLQCKEMANEDEIVTHFIEMGVLALCIEVIKGCSLRD